MRKVCVMARALIWSGVLTVSVLALEAAKPAEAPASRTPTIDQSLEWQSAFNPKISSDGKRVVYEVQKANWEENAFERNLWIGDVASGETHTLTTAKKSSTNPEWSPDGRWIAFLSDRPGQIAGTPEGKKQLYVISVEGGEAQQVTKVENDVNDFAWAPDSKRIAFSMSDPETKTRKDRKEKYGEYSVVHGDYAMTHLWIVEFSSGSTTVAEPKRLTEGDKFSVGDFSWSPDGAHVAFSAQKEPDLISLE
ncbi:MAG TPA: DPP IV N-terminal domain-containing protein, partial [Candidatus Dormibacteraeota bacterium]|nr:DPP IV N-terminal domain-containing protein [Candidatus Dormibacteraeota bacterium]